MPPSNPMTDTEPHRELDASPAEDVLNWLWRDLILSRNPNYGDWEYPAQAYRHIICEVNDRIAAARADAALPICDTPTEGEAGEGLPVSQGTQ